VHAFDDSYGFARRLARAAQERLAGVAVRRFPDGETLVRVAQTDRDAILVRSLADPDCKLFETILAANALREAGARRVTLVVPYLPYMRQDKVFHPGEPISQRVIGDLLSTSFDAVLTMEPHLHRVHSLREVFRCRAVNISAAPAIAGWIRRNARRAIVVGPDEESARWVKSIARAAGIDHAVGSKERFGDRRVRVHFEPIRARHAVIVDDIASSGATLAAAARALRAHGVVRVDALVVHAIFATGALATVHRAGVHRVLSCDTIPHPTNAIWCAPLFADRLRKPS